MCNLYQTKRSSAEIAQLMNFELGAVGNTGGSVYPGTPGLVAVNDTLQSMVWGFPLILESKRTGQPLKPKPVNNARKEKLDSFFWRSSFDKRRCLIPLTAWAEAEGERGAMTRTWMSVPDAPAFTVAGVWRDSDEWGQCYSMIMVDAAGDAAKVHNRMPVIVKEADRERWTSSATDDALVLCSSYDRPLVIDRTDTPWTAR